MVDMEDIAGATMARERLRQNPRLLLIPTMEATMEVMGGVMEAMEDMDMGAIGAMGVMGAMDMDAK